MGIIQLFSMRPVISWFLISLIIVVVHSYPRFSPGSEGLRLTDEELKAVWRVLLRQIEAEFESGNHAEVVPTGGGLPDMVEKRNYNLDHLARMNFRRSYRAGQLNNRH